VAIALLGFTGCYCAESLNNDDLRVRACHFRLDLIANVTAAHEVRVRRTSPYTRAVTTNLTSSHYSTLQPGDGERYAERSRGPAKAF
jgi:hypothetical protein